VVSIKAVTASDIETRENEIVRAQKLTADLHNEAGITDFEKVSLERFEVVRYQ